MFCIYWKFCLFLDNDFWIDIGVDSFISKDEISYFDDFNIALKELTSQGNQTYFLGDFNIIRHTKTHTQEAQANQRLLKPYLEACSAFGLTQLINKPTRSTLKTLSLLDHILTNSKESVTQHGVITSGLSDHNIIFCTRKTKCFKTRKHNTISVRTYKNYSKK